MEGLVRVVLVPLLYSSFRLQGWSLAILVKHFPPFDNLLLLTTKYHHIAQNSPVLSYIFSVVLFDQRLTNYLRARSHHRLWNQARPGMALSKRQLRYSSPPGFVQRVMMLLVESGAIYCAIWVRMIASSFV